MRYLKKYNESREDAAKLKKIFSDKINFDLIQLIKDISLEYLDEGWVLYLSVRSDTLEDYNSHGRNTAFPTKRKFNHHGWRSGEIFSLVYWHHCSNPEGEWNWNIDDHDVDILISDYKINGLRYTFSINKRLHGHGESASLNPECKEILERVLSIYPNENITIN